MTLTKMRGYIIVGTVFDALSHGTLTPLRSVRADSIGATARQSMDGAERGTPL